MKTVFQTAVDSIALGSLYALFALGIALIFGIMRLVNFAHGELVMLSALTIVGLKNQPPLVMLIGAIVAPIAAALVMDRVVFKPVRGGSPTTMLVMSFGVSIGIQRLTEAIRGDTLPAGANVSSWLSERVTIGRVVIPHLSIVTVASVVTLLIALGLFFRHAPIGVQMRAAAEDFDMARLLGIRANVVIAVAFAISGALAGVGAFLLMAQTGTWSTSMGLVPVIFGFAATVLGGLGSLSGAVIGGYAVGTLATTLQVALPASVVSFRDAILFLILFVVLALRPQGLIQLKSQLTRVG